MKYFILSLLILPLFKANAQIPIAFPSEYIDFKIDSIYFSVNGIYTFKNKTDEYIRFNIIFPFSSNITIIDSITVFNLSKLKNVYFKKYDQNISFYIELFPFDSAYYNIFYRQKLAKKNTYILTTTKSWGEPFQTAVYSLTSDKNIKILSLSMKPDSVVSDTYNNTYYWNKRHFMPENDFEVIIDE